MISRNGTIPFLDLVSCHEELEPELLQVFQTALRTARFVGGPMVEEFEREFARFCEATHCIGLASGTDAVRFALMGGGVKPGDLVITVPHTFIATTEAITQAGARPVFVDIDDRTYCMDPQRLEVYLDTECFVEQGTGATFHRRSNAPVTAVVPVHMYGHMADMDPILELAQRYKLIVVEDACQAHGAEYFPRTENGWRKAGSMGQAAAFSFYPGKNLGACGEAGAVTTDDDEIARKIRMLRDHGQAKKYYHDFEGYNGRLDAIQAGILRVKLRHLGDWNRQRQQAAQRYHELFSGTNQVVIPTQATWSRAVYHLYVIRVQDRDGLRKHLAEAGIDTAIHYPVPLHLQTAYQNLGYAAGDFPVTEAVASKILSLPIFPQLDPEKQRGIVGRIHNFVSSFRSTTDLERRIASSVQGCGISWTSSHGSGSRVVARCIPYEPRWMNDDLRIFRKSVREFIRKEFAPHQDRWREQRRPDAEAWKAAGVAGILLPDVPEEYGGGGSFAREAIVAEELAQAGIHFASYVHNVVAHYILAYSTQQQKRNWLPRMARGELVGAIAITEPTAGSDMQGIKTTARRDGDRYVINGSKTFITNGYHASLICMAVKTDPKAAGCKNISLLIVEPKDLPGYRVGRPLEKVGMHGQDACELFFKDVRVPASNLLGGTEGKGFWQLMEQLPRERLVIAVGAVAAAEQAVTITSKYVKGRRAFGKSLIEFQNTRFKLAECKTEAQIGRVFLDHCIERFIAGELDATTVAMAKYWLTDCQCRIVDECVQLHGGYGYMTEYPIARMWADSRVQRIYGGSNEVMKEVIASTL